LITDVAVPLMTDVTADATAILARFANIGLEQDLPQPACQRAIDDAGVRPRALPIDTGSRESAGSHQVPNQPPRYAGMTP
jgi:hypothetical protein